MIVVVLIMLVLTLIAIAMSKNANNESRQALDRQLGDQAYYNAESGINDVINYLYKNPSNPAVAVEQIDDCQWYKTATPTLGDGLIDADGINRYTCLLYNKAPKTLEFDNIGLSDSKIVPIEVLNENGDASVPLGSLNISWDDADATGSVAGCDFTSGSPPLPVSLPNNCTVGGVRVDIIRPQPNRTQLAQFTTNAFLLPHRNAGGLLAALPIYPDNQGIISNARCDGKKYDGSDAPRRCNMTITNLGAGQLVLHIRSLYKPTDVSVNGTDTSSAPVRFTNAQVMVDATGKANDVLRRVQVRLPVKPQYYLANFGIQTRDSICKVMQVTRTPANEASTTNTTDCPIDAP